nr:hypothetical protein [uncultured Methanospirillum sp.]
MIAQGGFNRGFSSQETQTLTIYREGRFSLIIEGDFISVCYDIKTREPVPVSTQIQTPVSNEKIPEEAIMMRKLRGS